MVGNSLQLARDPLGFTRRCVADYGDVVFLRVRGLDVYLVADPPLLDEVFVARRHDFRLDRLSRGLADALGRTLLVTDGDFWHQQRRLVQPAFHPDRMHGYAALIARLADAEVATWAEASDLDVFRRMSALSLQIVGATVLGVHGLPETVVTDELAVLMRHILGVANTGLRIPPVVPTPGNVRAQRAMERISAVLERSLDGSHQADDGTVASLLEDARRRGTDGLTADQVRDELVTMMLVGHETSALALTYTFWLLAQHPHVQEEAASEVEEVLGGRRAGVADLQRLELLGAVVHEALRLYPPVWAMGREATVPVDLGGYVLEPGAQVLISPWVLHRDERFFPRPDAFWPQRWLRRSPETLPRNVFLPFGGGARYCVGSRLAVVEILLVLAAALPKFRFVGGPGARLSLVPTVTLRPRRRVVLRLEKRQPLVGTRAGGRTAGDG